VNKEKIKEKKKMREQEDVHKPNYVVYFFKNLKSQLYFKNDPMRILCL